MSIIDAVYRVAHAYPGGIPALAARMGVSKHVLQNKVNPNNYTHHVTVEEAAAIADLTDTDDIAQAFAARRDMICIRIPSFDGVADSELLDLFLRLDKEKGDWAQAMQKSLADGRIDPREFEAINQQFREYCAAAAEVMSRLESMVSDQEARS